VEPHSRLETFSERLAFPQGSLLPALEALLLKDGRLPVRWAIMRREGSFLIIEGSRLVPCSQSSI
jgi:hypothetical protein